MKRKKRRNVGFDALLIVVLKEMFVGNVMRKEQFMRILKKDLYVVDEDGVLDDIKERVCKLVCVCCGFGLIVG